MEKQIYVLRDPAQLSELATWLITSVSFMDGRCVSTIEMPWQHLQKTIYKCNVEEQNWNKN